MGFFEKLFSTQNEYTGKNKVQNYNKLLKEYYKKYGNYVFQDNIILEIQTKTKHDFFDIKKDLRVVRKDFGDIDYAGMQCDKDYWSLLRRYYIKYKDNVYHSTQLKQIQIFTGKDIPTIKTDLKTVRENLISNQNQQQHNIKAPSLSSSYQEQSAFQSGICLNLDLVCHKADNDSKSTERSYGYIKNENEYTLLLKRYYKKYGDQVFHLNVLNKLQKSTKLSIVELKRDLKEVRKNLESQEEQQKFEQVSQLKSTTQAKSVTQPKPATPPKPIQQSKPATPKTLNESDLFNCVKAIPIRFDFSYPQMKENQKLNALCNMLLSGDMISQVLDAGNIENFEHNLQTKRLRNTNQEDYNKSLENNILFELYKYSSLMNLFKVLEDRKSDKVKVDYQKLWEQIQVECKTRVQNLSVEKKKNLAIHNLLQKYDYDTRKFKMVVNDYIDVRENDYILSGMMSSILYIVMNSVFFGEINNQPILKMIKSYPSKEIMCMIEALIINTATLRLTTYANGGSMFERG